MAFNFWTLIVQVHAKNMPARFLLHLVKRYWRNHLYEKVNAPTDGQTTVNGRQTRRCHKRSACHSVTGELKIDKPPTGPFSSWTHYYLKNLCSGPLDHLTNQISRLYVLWMWKEILSFQDNLYIYIYI
jgi:hypothetical protein